MQFEELKIIEPILRALKDMQYINPTTIQEKSIPLILKRNDLLGSARPEQEKQQLLPFPYYSICF